MESSALGSTPENPSAMNNESNGGPAISMGPGAERIRDELPFLVTHWLANYNGSGSNDANSKELNEHERAAIAKIRKATSEIATALASIGAYGTTYRAPLESPASFWNKPVVQNRTFGDLNRMHGGLAPSHLEHLAQSVAFNAATADSSAINDAHTNYLLKAGSVGESAAAAERSKNNNDGSTNTKGRSLQEAIEVDGDDDASKAGSSNGDWNHEGQSILRRPTLIASTQHSSSRHATTGETGESNDATVQAEREGDPSPTIDVKATHWEAGHQTAETVRQFLTVREKLRSTNDEIRSLEASMALQQGNNSSLRKQMDNLGGDVSMTAADKIEAKENIHSDQQAAERVISQLTRKLSDLHSGQKTLELDVRNLESRARLLDKRRRSMLSAFRDPFAPWKGSLSKGSRVGGCLTLQTIVGREQGLSRGRVSRYPSSMSNLPGGPIHSHFLELRKNLLATRLSHGLTINAHMTCPVYCLRFDRTGRYFITGSDDFLLKVFYIGAAQSCKRLSGNNRNRRLRCNYGANIRGAVLVCTLRGHAGVINDIDVSMDNCFLATASVDGDVRVWGLKNGCPVAILRGHKGGANMVSWSTLTPYRLVSTGSDGFARVWDIRDACLKRYGNMVSQRGEYNLRLTQEEKKAQSETSKNSDQDTEKNTSADLLPPLPFRGETSLSPTQGAALETLDVNGPPQILRPGVSEVVGPARQPPGVALDNNNGNNNGNELIVPPLPQAVPPLGQGADGRIQNQGGRGDNAAEEIPPAGQFVANDLIDEGVKLLSKYQHGNIQEDHGPGTRSRRSAVNVICVARCPLGKQFVTGSDDGILRVWEDLDDNSVAIVDARLSKANVDIIQPNRKASRLGVDTKPLLKLTGHVSTITDLSYSHAGDRILSASQKDGVVRVWNIGMSTATGSGGRSEFKDKRVTQIVMKLVNPFSNKPSQPTRRRPGNGARNAGSKVSCDVAVWTHDDSCIVTSQCVLLKESGTDIQPGSHLVCMWDSKSGRCLISISGAHSSQCQVLLPHPLDASILCTASTDGYVKVWDWNQGKCIFTHRNKVDFGPTDPNNSSKVGGYLDGSFSPDGSVLVLTDDDGYITILDSISKNDEPSSAGNTLKWMREQYFASDYYDLAYDRNGYCIEKGSGKPPHLAPKGARCAHNGSSFSDDINETFQRLSGPSPIPEKTCTWQREQIRTKRACIRHNVVPSAQEPNVRVSVREFDPLSTIVIKGIGYIGDQGGNSKSQLASTSTLGSSNHSQGGVSNRPSASTRAMSANYNYLDYDDLIRREGNPEEDDPDSDDEEFEPTAARTRVNNNEAESDEDDDLDDLSVYSETTGRRSRVLQRQRNQASSRTSDERRVRAQRRAHRNDIDFVEIDSDDELISQFVSANRTPSGPYERDYRLLGHFWRLKSQMDAARISRDWLLREESDSTYFGRTTYTPQMGDSIVYIPRAHYETIKECPSLSPPWHSWPSGAVWPVVRCFVRGMRLRFPYEDYFRKQNAKCTSIVSILTLEVTGIPEISDDREFPWPKPSFVEPTRPFVFELSVFLNSSCEYVIPESLYTSRISALENHIRSRGNNAVGLEVDLYYDLNGDSDMQAWPATIEGIISEEPYSNVHLQGSGFGVVQVCDGSEENRDYANPWELNTEGVNLTRPCLNEEEKKAVLQELNRLLRKEGIGNHLSAPVDQQRYCDYALMVEIPMDLMLIKRRLAANFYGSKLAVAADLRLVRDNCIKYNTEENEMSEICIAMCNEFEANILSDEERSQMISELEFDKIHKEQSEGQQVSSLRIRLSARTIQDASQAAGSGGRYTLRDRASARGQSSIEIIQPSENDASQRGRNRRNDEAAGTSREQHRRSRVRNSNVGILGQVPGAGSARRDVSATERQRIQNEFTEAAGRRSSRGRSLRGRPVYNETSNHESDEEENITRTSRSERATRRSSRSPGSRGVLELMGAAVEDTTAVAPSRRAASASGGRATRGTRSTRSQYFEEHSEEEPNDEEESSTDKNGSDAESQYSGNGGEEESAASEDEELMDDIPSRKRSRTAPTSARAAARSSQPAADSPGRRSSRSSGKQRKIYEEVDSDADEYASESDDSESVVVTPARPSGRSSRRAANRYADPDSEAEEEESDEEEEPPPRRSATKRKRQSPARSSGGKKLKGKKSLDLPELNKWPEISVSDITKVTMQMVERVRGNDEGGLFWIPVVEAYPDIADAYLKVIDTPMDLRTIEEERAHIYDSIAMLQEDLVLMFRNCCVFNGQHTDLAVIAIAQWVDLNQIFFDVCKELGVLIPRRWKP